MFKVMPINDADGFTIGYQVINLNSGAVQSVWKRLVDANRVMIDLNRVSKVSPNYFE